MTVMATMAKTSNPLHRAKDSFSLNQIIQNEGMQSLDCLAADARAVIASKSKSLQVGEKEKHHTQVERHTIYLPMNAKISASASAHTRADEKHCRHPLGLLLEPLRFSQC